MVRKTPSAPATGDLTHSPDNKPAGDILLSFVERVERITEEIEGLQDDRKEIYAEAKAVGYDTKILRQLIRLRKMNVADLKEQQAVMDLYRSAIEKAEKERFKKSEATAT